MFPVICSIKSQATASSHALQDANASATFVRIGLNQGIYKGLQLRKKGAVEVVTTTKATSTLKILFAPPFPAPPSCLGPPCTPEDTASGRSSLSL